MTYGRSRRRLPGRRQEARTYQPRVSQAVDEPSGTWWRRLHSARSSRGPRTQEAEKEAEALPDKAREHKPLADREPIALPFVRKVAKAVPVSLNQVLDLAPFAEPGKALTHEQEGSHPELSLQVLTKYNESPQVINAALCGHENVEPETIEAVLTEAADGISAARPGARRDVLESYIKRLAKLEEIAMSYKGVELCYAIQAGRELRVMTKAEQISDLDAHQLAKDISKRIEAEMQYPGHIKVVVIRETRAVEVAK